MVAVETANRASAAALAAELGSLMLAHTEILDPRWRLDAIVRRVPAAQRFGVSLASTRDAIRTLGRRATCPAPLREVLLELVEQYLGHHLDAAFVHALWLADWRSCARVATEAARRLGAPGAMERIISLTAASPAGRYATPSMVRRVTLADVIGLVDDDRAEDAERLARELPSRERVFATAHLARLDVRAGRAPRRVGGSARWGAELLIVREVLARGDLERGREIAERIERELLREYARLAIARAWHDRGCVVEALRTLGRVQRSELVAERELLRVEIRMRVRSEPVYQGPTDRRAWEPPRWLRPAGWLSRQQGSDLYLAAAFARLSIQGDTTVVPFAVEHAARLPPRTVLDFLARIGVAVPDVLTAMRLSLDVPERGVRGHRTHHRTAIDMLLAEHVALRAEALACTRRELPEPMQHGLRESTDDLRSPSERAWFDEGVALSPSAARRRRVLVDVSRATLRGGVTESDAVRARLRILVHLGGGLAADAIATLLATLPISDVTATDVLARLDALCALDATRAGDVVRDRFGDLASAGIGRAALGRVVAAGGLDRALARELEQTFARVREVHPDGAKTWFANVAAGWRASTGARLDVHALAWLRRCKLDVEPSAILDEAAAMRCELLALAPRELADRLARDDHALAAALLVPPRVDARMIAWTLADWRELLETAANSALHLEPAIVRRCARLLGRPVGRRALACGDLAALGVIATQEITVERQRYRVTLLDKRRDALTYLRFADVTARSCCRSDSSVYTREDGTQGFVIDAWMDPLTLCYRIERETRDGLAPCGFLLGSFAIVEDRPAVLFNSLHVRPNHHELRTQVLCAVERSLAALPLRYLGIANLHNGHGHLPADYREATREVVRLSGLAFDDDNPVVFVHDDISRKANTVEQVTLHWLAR